MTTENHIYDWLKGLGHKIAEHAEPLKGMGGDHDYDGAIDVVWRGIHEALDVQHDNCQPHIASHDCELDQYDNQKTYTGPSQPGGPVKPVHPDKAFQDGYDWSLLINEMFDTSITPHLNEMQSMALNVLLEHANQNPEFRQKLIDNYVAIMENKD